MRRIVEGVSIICPNVEDNPHNVTRFFILSKEAARPSGHDKTFIMFTTAHRAGALAVRS